VWWTDGLIAPWSITTLEASYIVGCEGDQALLGVGDEQCKDFDIDLNNE